MNRAAAAWNVGSIFKICVAAAALENGVEPPQGYCCEGFYRLGDHSYFCHQREGHGTVGLQQAMECSCNPYFVELGQQTGAGALLRMAQRLGFGAGCTLAEGVTAAAGHPAHPFPNRRRGAGQPVLRAGAADCDPGTGGGDAGCRRQWRLCGAAHPLCRGHL